MATYVLCHGGGMGGWIWKFVKPILLAAGHDVYTPTYTGFGERIHLLGAEIDGAVHVTDIVNVLKTEDITDCILVGHSYSGTVLPGVAAQSGDRIRRIVLLDSLVCYSGESIVEVMAVMDATQAAALAEGVKLGHIPPGSGVDQQQRAEIAANPLEMSPERQQWLLDHMTDQPLACTVNKLQVGAETVTKPVDYLAASNTIMKPMHTRARELGWTVHEFGGDHAFLVGRPEQTAEFLLGLARTIAPLPTPKPTPRQGFKGRRTKTIAQKDSTASGFVALTKAFSGKLADPYPTYARLRAISPVYQGDLVAELGVPSLAAGRDGTRNVFCLLGDEVARRALLDTDTFSTEIYREAFNGVMGDPVVLYLQDDPHRKYRNMLASILSPAALRDMGATHFKPTIDGMIAQLVTRGKGDLMEEFALDFPIRVIYKLFGLPSDDEAAMQRFANHALVMVLGGMIDPAKPEEAAQRIENAALASRELFEQLAETVQRRRAAGDSRGNDLIAQLLRYNVDGETFDDATIAQFLRPNLPASGETTSRAFANVMACLLERPEILKQVRADRGLIPQVINETMRFEGSVSIIPRMVARDVEVCGVKIPAGSGLNVLVGAANRDPAAHNAPEAFSLEKRSKQALSFGFGPHLCMGMPLAKKEMEIALNAILDQMPNIRLDPNGNYSGIKGIQFRSPPSLPVIWDT